MITPRKMKHLRYLDLSYQAMTAIPETITALFLLQTLRLISCYNLSTLPEGMRYMMSLQHLNIEGCPNLKCMPSYLGELKCLQTLTRYVVGTGVGNKIGELKSLTLGGKLEVYNLQEVGDARDAREANMASKENLDHLELHWGMPKDYNGAGTMVVNPFEVLDALKPCSKLKVLKIDGYSADRFPVWMMEHQILGNLVELHINKCGRCTNVMQFHMLPLLRILEIRSMDNLRYLCCGEDAPITFPSLKFLYLADMSNLDCWCEGDVGEETSLFFPVLRELQIIKCPMLSAIPIAPLLEEIHVTGNKILSCLAAGLTTLRFINMDERENNGTLPFKPWKCLEHLSIKGFNHIIPRTDGREGEELSIDVNATALRNVKIIASSFWFSPIQSNSPLWLWKCFRFIEHLVISGCDSLSSWPEKEFSNLINLRELKVKFCKNFRGSLSEPLSEMSPRQILLPKLEYLLIDECPNMVEVPKLPRSLKQLKIFDCNKLESLPEWLGNLVALKEVSIMSCENFNFLPSSIGCLTALEKLFINKCIKIASLPEGMQGLESLKTLIISDCPKIRVLPEGLLQRLRSLDEISIDGCPLLERDFRKHGKYWNLISEISKVRIGVEDRSSKMRDLTQLISSCKKSLVCQRNPKDIIICE